MTVRRSIVAIVIVLGFAVTPQARTQPAATDLESPDVVRVGSDATDRMTVPVRIGTNGPFAFLIDTGAERTVLSRDVALRLKLMPSGRATLMGVAGSQTVDLVDIEELALGRRSFYGLTAPLLDAENIGADGIVGLDSLQGQRVLLDFENNRMTIGDARSLGGNEGYEIVVTARRRSGQLIMTNADIDGVRTDIIVDTGSDTSIGNRALQRALSRHRHAQTTQLMSVTGQAITADIGVARQVQLGGVTLSNTLLAFADAPPFERLGMVRRPAVLLGMRQLRMFRRVAIDFDARRILFDMPANIPL